MALLIIFICIGLLVLLVSWIKVNPFIAFLVVSIIAGALLGIPINKVTASVQKGMGDILGQLLIIICLGAMLGKLVANSGAAQKIAESLVKAVSKKQFLSNGEATETASPQRIQLALVAAGFIIGIPLFYGIGFVLMVPLIFSVTYKYKLPAVYIGLPMLASLSVTHGFLPPHPSPSALVALFHGNMATTFIYGLMIAIPAVILAGPVFAQFLKKIPSQPLATFRAEELPLDRLPGALNSFLTALLPVILLMISALFPYLNIQDPNIAKIIAFLGDPSIVMLIALMVATFTLGIKQGKSMGQLAGNFTDAVKDVALILLIIAGSGAFKEVLTASGVSTQIANQLQALNLPPLLLGWVIAAIIRISLGSATVAGLTAAGIVAPLVIQNHVNPNLMVLSIGAGSLAFSHVNDSGFWLYKEYFNLSIKDTIKSWSMMETLVSVIGLIGVSLLNIFVK
ncbi:Gnt-I system high-affinity gluconate transporter [Mucilaginibacter oryzae]|uniref:Gnt-I system high-affinity gluconate transporter n=1 Tax=Mucilaginibacter oryzae TaxID=468058 RepID=A0A316HF02_9SPHI|nr:gluconate:H+ symporter [Mucilaginibacter oryzae]PWK79774.1 Gnt-I system high-affinity gluconate transporter [Mucilaginibacter oryzae]